MCPLYFTAVILSPYWNARRTTAPITEPQGVCPQPDRKKRQTFPFPPFSQSRRLSIGIASPHTHTRRSRQTRITYPRS